VYLEKGVAGKCHTGVHGCVLDYHINMVSREVVHDEYRASWSGSGELGLWEFGRLSRKYSREPRLLA